MSAAGVAETAVEVAGTPCRVWRKGSGPRLGVLAGLGGYLSWTPFLDALAASRSVIVPSLPGFPGGGRGHLALDQQLDWLLAMRDLLDGAGLDGADLCGISIGAALAAEVAAAWPRSVGRLVLVSPLGVCDEAEPVADPWGVVPAKLPALLAADPALIEAHQEPPDGADQLEWEVSQIRAGEAAARLLWPNADTGLARRLGRIRARTLLVWGSADRLVPASYHARFQGAIAGAGTRVIDGAGHLCDFDAPTALAGAINEFLG
jgi:pimeloyl-ACP methyl ester carboxylesterase